MPEYLLITAAGGRIRSIDSAEYMALKSAIEYYLPLGLPTIIAMSKSAEHLLVADPIIASNGDLDFVFVPDGVKGALATANFALAKTGISDGKLHIAAGDTSFDNPSAREAMRKLAKSSSSAGALVFPSSDPRHSFVALNAQSEVRYVAEKRLIGSWATSGNFYFAAIEEFISASEWCFTNNTNLGGNFFVSTALNFFVYAGKKVSVEEIDSESVKKLWPAA